LINNLEYLKSPEKLELFELYINEIFEIFKILSFKLNSISITNLRNIFLDLKHNFYQDYNNNINFLLSYFFKMLEEMNMKVPYIKKEKNIRNEKNCVVAEDFDEERRLFFILFNKKIKKFLKENSKLFEFGRLKTEQFYNYLIYDFNNMIIGKPKNTDKIYNGLSNLDISYYLKSQNDFVIKIYKDNIFLENDIIKSKKENNFLNKKRYNKNDDFELEKKNINNDFSNLICEKRNIKNEDINEDINEDPNIYSFKYSMHYEKKKKNLSLNFNKITTIYKKN